MKVISGTGRVHQVVLGFQQDSCCLIFCFLCNALYITACPFVIFLIFYKVKFILILKPQTCNYVSKMLQEFVLDIRQSWAQTKTGHQSESAISLLMPFIFTATKLNIILHCHQNQWSNKFYKPSGIRCYFVLIIDYLRYKIFISLYREFQIHNPNKLVQVR